MSCSLKIYIAGPYSSDPEKNTLNAIKVGEEVAKAGHIPYIPHLTHFWDKEYPHPVEFWYEYDLNWLRCCDRVIRIPGESTGADREVELANELGIPVGEYIGEL